MIFQSTKESLMNDTKVYGLMAQAEDIPKAAVELLRDSHKAQLTLDNVSKNALGAIRAGVRDEVGEILKQELRGASEGLLGLSECVREAVSSQVSLAHSTEQTIRGATWRFSLVLCIIGGLVAGGLWMFQDFVLDKAKKERESLLSEIASLTEQADKLKAKTWGIRLHEDSNGKFIILPKGKEADTNWNFGEQRAVLIIPKRK